MKKVLKKSLAGLLSAAALFTLCACGADTQLPEEEQPIEFDVSDSVSGKLLTAGESADNVFSLMVDYEKKLNPLSTKSTLNQMVGQLVYDNLFDVSNDFQLSSRILSDWYYVEDSNTWVLTPREDILMHDGEPLTAEDIVYSLSRVYSQGLTYYQQRMGHAYVSSYQGIVYVAGDYGDSLLPYRLTVPIIRHGSILEEAPVGSGPYMFNEDHTELNRFEDYENAELLPLDTIYLRQFTDAEELITEYESALVDIVLNDPTGIYNMGYGGKNEKRVLNTTNMHYLGFNAYSDFFCYDQYRYALNWIIDRDGIAEDVLDGAATASALPIHPDSELFDPELNASFDYDPERCLIEFEELGCRDLDDDGFLEFAMSGSKVEITVKFLVCADNAVKVLAARRIAEDLRAIGLDVDLKELSWKQYIQALKDGDFDMYYAETAIGPDWNTLPFFEGLDDEENVTNLNYGRWYNETAEDAVYAFLAAGEESREEARNVMLQELTFDSYFIPICFEKQEVVSHLGVIFGMDACQHNIFHNMTNWTVNLE